MNGQVRLGYHPPSRLELAALRAVQGPLFSGVVNDHDPHPIWAWVFVALFVVGVVALVVGWV